MSTTQKHIVIVTSEFPPQPGGIGNHSYNLALFLSKAGYRIDVITDNRSQAGRVEHDFDSKLPFTVKRIHCQKWRVFMYFKRIRVTFSRFKKADVVIATGKFSLWNVAFCRLLINRRTLAVLHGSEVNHQSVVLKTSIHLALKHFDKLIAVSNYTKSLIAHVDKDSVVIPNGISLSDWQDINVKSNLFLNGNPSLTTVGRLSLRKGQLQVIKHLPKLIKRFPELHYHCIGIDKEIKTFKNLAKDLGVNNYITFHGAIDTLSLKQMLKQTDIFVMLSAETQTGDVEGFGIAILEANAMGTPAIGAKGCGIEDAIKDGESGMLIDGTQAEAFENAIEHILKQKTKYDEAANQWAQEHDWQVIIKQYIAQIE